MNRLLRAACALACAIGLLFAPSSAMAGAPPFYFVSAAITATGSTATFDMSNGGVPPAKHTITAVVTGTPTTCTFVVYGSNDNVNFFDISGTQSCTASMMFHIVDRSVLYLKITSTITGTTSIVFTHAGGL